jgi:hypothetical protein
MTYAYPVSFPLRWKIFPFPNQLFVSSAGAPSISFFYQDVAPNGAKHQVIAYLKALAFFLFVNLKKSRMKAIEMAQNHLNSGNPYFLLCGKKKQSHDLCLSGFFSIALEDLPFSKPTFRIQRWGTFNIFFLPRFCS